MTLATEATRINRDMDRILSQSRIDDEVPVRIHSRDTDAGGAPELHPAFVRYIGQVCWCGRRAVCDPGCRATRGDEHLSTCEPPCTPGSFRTSQHKAHPQRLKRAFRQLRTIAPQEYDACWLIAALGFTWHGAMERINTQNVSRGRAEYSEADFTVLTIAGFSKIVAAF